MKPLTIVGGGLAGLSLGIALRQRSVPVTLHEASTYPRHRVCGEFIAGAKPEVFAELGIAECLGDARLLRDTAWRYRSKPVFRRRLPTPAYGISRYALDERLAERFTSLGGELLTHARYRGPEAEDGLVWASGRERSASDWIGLKMHCLKLETAADLEVHLGEQAYVGVCPVEGSRVNVCGLFKLREVKAASRVDQLPAYLADCGLTELAERVRSGEPDPPSAVGVTALSYASRPTDDVIRLGDQAGLIAPFTGNGMAMAFESAALAVDPLCNYATGQTDWSTAVTAVNQRLHTALSGRRKIARWLHPWFLSPRKQNLLAALAGGGCLPFGLLFRLTH